MIDEKMMKESTNRYRENYTRFVEKEFKSEIDSAIDNTKIYSEKHSFKNPEKRFEKTSVTLWNATTDKAIARCCNGNKNYNSLGPSDENRIAALNFASFKNPGGFFLGGSRAQEEMVCEKSFLFNVLCSFDDKFYKQNRKESKSTLSLYKDRALYTKGVLFNIGEGRNNLEKSSKADIITCAAPNFNTFIRNYENEDLIEMTKFDKALLSRIEFVLKIAAENNVETLILGAFGCGVFGCNPYPVSIIFMNALKYDFEGVFKNVIFAIPNSPQRNGTSQNNYEVFKETIDDDFYKEIMNITIED